MVNTAIFLGFSGSDRPNRPPWICPGETSVPYPPWFVPHTRITKIKTNLLCQPYIGVKGKCSLVEKLTSRDNVSRFPYTWFRCNIAAKINFIKFARRENIRFSPKSVIAANFQSL